MKILDFSFLAIAVAVNWIVNFEMAAKFIVTD